MIENLSSWAKGITLAVIVVSILEMLLPNNTLELERFTYEKKQKNI